MNTLSKKQKKNKQQIDDLKARIKTNYSKRKQANKFEVIDRLRNLRKEKNLTQEDLAEILDKSVETYKKYENGNIFPIPDSVAYDLALIYDTTPDYILGFTNYRHAISKDNITEEIGLTEQSVDVLHKINKSAFPIFEDIGTTESKKTIDFINYALSHYEERTEESVINYIYTIFALFNDYISFIDGKGEFRTTNEDGNTSIDRGYIVYESTLNELPTRLQLNDYTKLLLKEKIIEALDNLRALKRKEYYESINKDVRPSRTKQKQASVTVNNLDSIGYEIIETNNKGVTVRKKKSSSASEQ